MLASQAVYTLSGGKFSGPSNDARTAFTTLEQNYVIEKHNHHNYLLVPERPKDWILCSPRTPGAQTFYIFSVKGSVGLDDWLDNLAAGDNVRTCLRNRQPSPLIIPLHTCACAAGSRQSIQASYGKVSRC